LEVAQPERAQRHGFFDGFDPLGDHQDVEFPAQRDDVPRDGGADFIAPDVASEIHIDLQYIRKKIRQHVQARVTRSEVIDRRDHSVAPVFCKNRLEVSDIPAGFVLGDFEHQLVQRKSRAFGCFEGLLQAGGGLINGVGKKIDAENLSHFEVSGQFDGLHATGLVEGVAIAVIDEPQNIERGPAIRRTYQSLVGVNASILDVHDGLEGHRELRKVDIGSARTARELF